MNSLLARAASVERATSAEGKSERASLRSRSAPPSGHPVRTCRTPPARGSDVVVGGCPRSSDGARARRSGRSSLPASAQGSRRPRYRSSPGRRRTGRGAFARMAAGAKLRAAQRRRARGSARKAGVKTRAGGAAPLVRGLAGGEATVHSRSTPCGMNAAKPTHRGQRWPELLRPSTYRSPNSPRRSRGLPRRSLAARDRSGPAIRVAGGRSRTTRS